MDTPLTPKIALEERDNCEALLADLNEADEQLAHGEFTEYDPNQLQELSDRVEQRGRAHIKR